MSLKRNIVANVLGQGWAAVMGVAFVPLYIRLLGMEAYGLIGVFAVLQAWLALLDAGLGLALNREMARFTAGQHGPQEIRDLLRSVETVCLGLAVLAVLLVWVAAPWVAGRWLRPQGLPVAQVELALQVMGFTVGCRLLETLYHGAVLGLQRQVAVSLANAAMATVRWGGAVLALLAVEASVTVFFAWHGAVSLATIAVYAWMLYRQLPPAARQARFSRAALAGLGRFAAGVAATTLLALLLTQLDKVVLSRLLSLEAFGHYALAALLAGAIQQLILPISQAYYPRLTHLVAADDEAGVIAAYHDAAQLVAAAIIPVAMLLIAFGEPLLWLWSGDARLAAATAPLLAVLTAGALLNGFMSVPYQLQLASGWSAFPAKVNTVAVLVFVPAILLVAPRHGALGTAWLWVALNAGYVAIAVGLMHRRLLPREKWPWYREDLLFPLVACAAVMVPAALFRNPSASTRAQLAWVLFAGAAGAAAAVAAMPRLRRQLGGMRHFQAWITARK